MKFKNKIIAYILVWFGFSLLFFFAIPAIITSIILQNWGIKIQDNRIFFIQQYFLNIGTFLSHYLIMAIGFGFLCSFIGLISLLIDTWGDRTLRETREENKIKRQKVKTLKQKMKNPQENVTDAEKIYIKDYKREKIITFIVGGIIGLIILLWAFNDAGLFYLF